MIRHELVDEEKWITPQRFNRILAIYQALPGPEAHEICVYFGMIARGRPGAILAGLGFMLPGFVLMLVLSWFYVTFGVGSPVFRSVFLGMQPAVAALIVRAVHRIGGHALHQNKWLWGLAFFGAFAQLLEVNFMLTLLISGTIYALAARERFLPALGLGTIAVGVILCLSILVAPPAAAGAVRAADTAPDLTALLFSGLRSGLLTFGGAYTVIPYLQHDAVNAGGWMTNSQFLDGLALSGLLPAPLIIFATFVGYLGGGLPGALVITAGIFAPSFLFTIIGHTYVERLVENKSAHAFLDGVTAGVVGLIAATGIGILSETVVGRNAWVIFTCALTTLFVSKSKWATALVVISAGLFGLALL